MQWVHKIQSWSATPSQNGRLASFARDDIVTLRNKKADETDEAVAATLCTTAVSRKVYV